MKNDRPRFSESERTVAVQFEGLFGQTLVSALLECSLLLQLR